MSAGIDYSNGTANFDPETGIHYGIISIHAEGFNNQIWCDESISQYGEPTCPDCGEKVEGDIFPTTCCSLRSLQEEDLFPDEPVGFSYEDDGYSLWQSHDDSDIWVFKSPYVTKTRFCSPCAPGAGDLSSPDEDGVLTYALGPEWFDGEAPYTLERRES